jgi:hypothetical protein
VLGLARAVPRAALTRAGRPHFAVSVLEAELGTEAAVKDDATQARVAELEDGLAAEKEANTALRAQLAVSQERCVAQAAAHAAALAELEARASAGAAERARMLGSIADTVRGLSAALPEVLATAAGAARPCSPPPPPVLPLPPLLVTDPATVAGCREHLAQLLQLEQQDSHTKKVLEEVLASNCEREIIALYVFLVHAPRLEGGRGRAVLSTRHVNAMKTVKQMAELLPCLSDAAAFTAWEQEHATVAGRPGEERLELFKECCGVGLLL